MRRFARSALGVGVFAVGVLVACGPRPIPPGSPDQTVGEAMRLVCDAPARAARDRGEGTRSDKIAGHLTDGIANARVLAAVEAWKTDGIDRDELAALVREAGLRSCALQDEAP